MAPSLDSKLDHRDDVESNTPGVAYGRDGEPSHNIQDYYKFDPEAERRLVRKLDARLMPLIFCLYIFNAIDRSNLGEYSMSTERFYLPIYGIRQGMQRRMAWRTIYTSERMTIR